MQYFDPYIFIGIGSLGIGILIFILFLFKLNLRRLPNLFFLLFGLATIWEIFLNILVHSKLLLEFPGLYLHSGRYRSLICALILSWILSQNRKWKFYIFLVLVPAMLDIVLFWIQNLSIPVIQKLLMSEMFYLDTRPGPHNPWNTPQFCLRRIIFPVLCLTVSWFLLRYRIKNYSRSGLTTGLEYFMLGFAIVFLFEYPISVFFYEKWDLSFVEWPVEILLYTTLIVSISLFTLGQLEFNKRSVLLNQWASVRSSKKNQLEYSRLSEILGMVKQKIESEKLFLNPGLSLTELSKILRLNSHYISQAVNTQTGLRFSDFINQYRIEESMKMLLQKEFELFTVEAIAQQCGFQSKSAFYRAFKKDTGLSPTQYRAKNKN